MSAKGTDHGTPRTRKLDVVTIAFWLFVLVEALGIGFVLWTF